MADPRMTPSRKQKNLARRAETFSPEAVARKVLEEEAKKVRKRPDSTVQAEPGDNRKIILHSIQLAAIPPTDMDDPDAVTETVFKYFEICAENDMKPSMADLALALSLTRGRLNDYLNGSMGKGDNSARTREVLKKAVSMLDGQMNAYMANGKINPVAGIFLMKNHFGYQNDTEVVVKPVNPLGEGQTEQELTQKYIDSVQIVASDAQNEPN